MNKTIALFVVCASSLAVAQVTHKVIQNGFACQTKSVLKTIVDLKGNAAAQKAELAKNLTSGQCINLKKGDVVLITGENFMSDLVKIRYPSKTKEYWTTADYVK